MTCPACQSERVSSDFGERGIVSKCLDCEHKWSGNAQQAPRPVAVAPVRPVPVTVAVTATLSKQDILSRARSELKALNAEIRRLEKLKRQRDELKRLLAAAKTPKPNATIRALRKQG